MAEGISSCAIAGRRTLFLYVSAVDVLRGGPSAQALRDTLVFVGATALGVKDVVITPLDTLVAGVEVHATVADNLVRRNFLSRPDYAPLLEAAAVFLSRDLCNPCLHLARRGRVGRPVVRVPRFHLGCHVLGVLVWTASSSHRFCRCSASCSRSPPVSTAGYTREHSKAERAAWTCSDRSGS